MSKVDVFNTADELRSRGYVMRDPPVTILSYDPAADGDDRDALVITSREEHRRGELWDPDLSVEFIFRVMFCHYMPPDATFPDKVAAMLNLNRTMRRWQRAGKIFSPVITVESNGVGYGMASTMSAKLKTPVISYTTVAKIGSDKPFEAQKPAMPRLTALDNLRVLLELHRVKVAKDAVGHKLLKNEMNSFVWASPGRPAAIGGQRDDMIMALTAGVWFGSKVIPPVTKQQKFGIGSRGDRRTGSMRM